MPSSPAAAVYGTVLPALADTPAGAVQVAPHMPGAASLEAMEAGSLASMLMLAPPGTVERRYAIAQALRALAPDGRLTVLAPKDKGGSRLAGDLAALGAPFNETARRHHRICVAGRPADLGAVEGAIAEGAPRYLERLGLWTQPGVFSWDRVDAGTAQLMERMPALTGRGADLGCGLGVLASRVLQSPAVSALVLVDNDRRAVEAARRNVDDARADIRWADVRVMEQAPADLDFVVMNPPFHDGGAEDRALGQAFIRQAAEMLKKGGVLWIVANRHLPYEAVLAEHFARVTPHGEGAGFKVHEARR